jgi:hypothetical protein
MSIQRDLYVYYSVNKPFTPNFTLIEDQLPKTWKYIGHNNTIPPGESRYSYILHHPKTLFYRQQIQFSGIWRYSYEMYNFLDKYFGRLVENGTLKRYKIGFNDSL